MMVRVGIAGAVFLATSVSLAGAATFNVVAKTGDVAPGTGGATYTGFGFPALNNAGETAFRAGLTGTGVTRANDTAVFTSSALVAREGDAAPGTGGQTYADFGLFVSLNDSGETAFRVDRLEPAASPAFVQGIFTSSALVARAGDVAPGTGGATYRSLGANPALNNAGETAFLADFAGAGATGANDSGVFKSSGLVVREGDVAPGTGGATYRLFQGPQLNDAGETAFLGGLTGAGVTSANERGIFTSNALVVREGDVAPETRGATHSFLRAPSLNDSGEIAFTSALRGGVVTPATSSGIFTSSALVARAGDVAPSTGGATFQSFDTMVSLNNAGETAFVARLTGAGVNFSNDFGLFFSDGDGRFGLIAREGDVIDLGGGDLRTISPNVFPNFRWSLNNEGTVAFVTSFTGFTSALFTVDTGTIPTFERQPAAVIPLPAPAALLLTGLAGLGLLAGRRRRPVHG